jgi:hypothetical protein
LTAWLIPTVKVISAFSATIGDAVGHVCLTSDQPPITPLILFEGVPTCGSDIHGYWAPPQALSEYLRQSFIQVIVTAYYFSLLRVLALVEDSSLTSSRA